MELAPPSGWHKVRVHSLIYLSVSVNHIYPSVFVFRSSRAVLQSDVVPQSGSRPHVHSSDRLSQRPLHSAMGQEETVHSGSLYRNTDRSGSVSERFAVRWVCVYILCISVNCSGVCVREGERINWFFLFATFLQPLVLLHLTNHHICLLFITEHKIFFYYWCINSPGV